jgi:Family of unknown function (DUF6130)
MVSSPGFCCDDNCAPHSNYFYVRNTGYIIDPPLEEPLMHGRVVIQYRAENLRIVPVFGPAALAVSPRIGHIHVTVDDSPWQVKSKDSILLQNEACR